MLYRIRQFFSGAFKRLTKSDVLFINTYLNEEEKKLFFALPRYEMVHSIGVAREVLDKCLVMDAYDIMLIKAALLHDIGKIKGGLNLITKSIMVILDKVCPKILKKMIYIKAVNTYYNHPKIAVELLKNENEYVKYLIENHHNYDIKNDEKLKILQVADSNN